MPCASRAQSDCEMRAVTEATSVAVVRMRHKLPCPSLEMLRVLVVQTLVQACEWCKRATFGFKHPQVLPALRASSDAVRSSLWTQRSELIQERSMLQ